MVTLKNKDMVYMGRVLDDKGKPSYRWGEVFDYPDLVAPPTVVRTWSVPLVKTVPGAAYSEEMMTRVNEVEFA